MATTSKQAARELQQAGMSLTTIYYGLSNTLKTGDTSKMHLNGKSIPGIMGQIDAAQKAIISMQKLMASVDITV